MKISYQNWASCVFPIYLISTFFGWFSRIFDFFVKPVCWLVVFGDLVNQRLRASQIQRISSINGLKIFLIYTRLKRAGRAANLIPIHYPLLTFNLWPTHNLSPKTIGIQKDPKSWSLSFANSISGRRRNSETQKTYLYLDFSRPFNCCICIKENFCW